MKKICAVLCALAVALPLVSCGDDKPQGDGSGMMYNVSLPYNPKSLDPQFADDEASNTVIANLYSGLMQFDIDGDVICCNAESYSVSDDGLTYTFNLRDDNYWFFDTSDDDIIDEDEYFPVTADDYVFALQRILTPEMHSPYSAEFSCIKGGKAALAGSASPEAIGVSAPDESTLVVALEYPSADFISLMATNAAVPCNEEFFISTKGRYGLDDDSVMSNGAFFVRQWFFDPYGKNNILYMKKNFANSSDENKVFPSFLSFTIEKSKADVREMFKNEKIDCFTTLNKNSFEKNKYTITSQQSITLGLVFNSQDEVCSNMNFRKALAYSLDRASLQTELGNDVTAAYGIIPPAVKLLGRSYRDLSADSVYDIFDSGKAAEFCSAAKAELNAESFGTIRLLAATDAVDSSDLHVVTRNWQDILGFYVSVEEVTTDEFYERIESGDYQIALYPLQGKYNSGVSVLEQLAANTAAGLSGNAKASVSSLRMCANSSELVGKFAAAEKVILDELSFIPIFYKNSYLIAEKGNQDIILDSFSDSVNFRTAKHFD